MAIGHCHTHPLHYVYPPVFRRCEVPRGRGQRRLRVYHGETYFDAEGCRACECRDGNATAFCSEPGNCSVVARGEADCVLSEESGGGTLDL